MKWGNQGMPKDLDQLNNLRVIFTVCCLVLTFSLHSVGRCCYYCTDCCQEGTSFWSSFITRWVIRNEHGWARKFNLWNRPYEKYFLHLLQDYPCTRQHLSYDVVMIVWREDNQHGFALSVYNSCAQWCAHICCYCAPDREAEYCNEHVCVCVCVCLSTIIFFGSARPISPKFLWMLPVAMAWSSWRLSDTLCTSGFMDDIICAH